MLQRRNQISSLKNLTKYGFFSDGNKIHRYKWNKLWVLLWWKRNSSLEVGNSNEIISSLKTILWWNRNSSLEVGNSDEKNSSLTTTLNTPKKKKNIHPLSKTKNVQPLEFSVKKRETQTKKIRETLNHCRWIVANEPSPMNRC